MSIASLLSIKVTSPITHMVSSAVRGVAASLLGMWLFHDIMTTYAIVATSESVYADLVISGRASSIGIILAGSILYTWIKNAESSPSATSGKAGATPAGYQPVKTENGDLELGETSKREDSARSRPQE
jgi:GDP-fucose transporter C1